MNLQSLCAQHIPYLTQAPRENSVHVVLEGDVSFLLFWSKSEATDREGVAMQMVDESLVPVIYPLDELKIKSIKKINKGEASTILKGGK